MPLCNPRVVLTCCYNKKVHRCFRTEKNSEAFIDPIPYKFGQFDFSKNDCVHWILSLPKPLDLSWGKTQGMLTFHCQLNTYQVYQLDTGEVLNWEGALDNVYIGNCKLGVLEWRDKEVTILSISDKCSSVALTHAFIGLYSVIWELFVLFYWILDAFIRVIGWIMCIKWSINRNALEYNQNLDFLYLRQLNINSFSLFEGFITSAASKT